MAEAKAAAVVRTAVVLLLLLVLMLASWLPSSNFFSRKRTISVLARSSTSILRISSREAAWLLCVCR